jgi:diguanylate cyclase (GGDEF)-like protein
LGAEVVALIADQAMMPVQAGLSGSFAPERTAATSLPVRSKMRIRFPVIVPAVVGLLLSFAASALLWQWEQRRSRQEFTAIAQSHFLALQRGLDEYLNALKAVRALLEVSDNVTREQFETFSGRLLAGHKAVQNFSWVPRVTRNQRILYEAAAVRDGIADYQIRAVTLDERVIVSPARDEYLPIFYSTVARTSRMYGIDLSSQPFIQQRLELARDNNALSAVPDFILHSQAGNVHEFLFSLPVYLRGQPHASVEERRRNLIGFTHGAFLTADAIEDILQTNTTVKGLDLSVFLGDAPPDAMPIYLHSSRLRTTAAEPRTLSALLASRHEASALNTASTRWTLVATPVPDGPLSERHDRAWLVLFAGLMVSGGVVQYMNASVRHAQRLMQANEEISNLARRDALTALYNRRAFNELLATSFAASQRSGRPFAVLCFDLDHFKEINDTLGHPAGDLLLQQAAQRVLDVTRQTDVVARLGGDEFAVLLADSDGPAAILLAGRINEILDQPFDIAGNQVHVTASIGIAQYTKQIMSSDGLIIQADLALYRAKADGRNCYRFHDTEIDRSARELVGVNDRLDRAVECGSAKPHLELMTE